MDIMLSEEKTLAGTVLDRMTAAGELCVSEEGLDPENIEVSLTFAGSDEIRRLNLLHRGVDSVTDVISFPQYEDSRQIPRNTRVSIGDVVICYGRALTQADEYGHSLERELVYLFVHSVLHLLGYDHMNEADRAKMRETEEKIMGGTGLPREEKQL
jgi:probable rRNA maturation factor